MRRIAILIPALLFCRLPIVSAADKDDQHEAAVKKAVASAEEWLKLVDQEKYGESWESAAAYLQGAVGKEQFVKALDGARKPLGKMISRKVASKEFRTSLPGAPDGQYVVIQFDTSLENKKEAVETITPMLEKDRSWKVSGYFIK